MTKLAIMVGGKEYVIDENGIVLKRRGKGFLKAFPDKDGYLKYAFTSDNNKTINIFVHRLVYEAFNGPIPDNMTVDHKDNNKLNNHFSNLKLMPARDNVIKGNARHYKLLSPTGDVVEIYNLREFARENNLHKAHIYAVANGKYRYKSHKGWRKFYE